MKTRSIFSLNSSLLLLFFLSTSLYLQAQQSYYTIASPELSLRQAPGTQAAVLTKIPYGAKVSWQSISEDTGSFNEVVIGGLPCHWQKVKYKETVGYVIDAYLSLIAPPKPGTKDLKAYVKQVSQPFGAPLKHGDAPGNITEGNLTVNRQLYQNGMVYSDFGGYEYMAETLQIPGESIGTVYNLLKNIDEFSVILKTCADLKEGEFKTKDSKGKEYTWQVTYHKENGMRWLNTIKIGWEEGGYYNLTLQALETEVMITYSSGV